MSKNVKNSNPSGSADYYTLDPEHTDPARLKREREKARKLRKSQWWLDLVNRGVCHYCGQEFPPKQLTMDHRVPLARGGTSTPGNLVPCCKGCNNQKGLATPVDDLFRQLESERLMDSGRDAATDDEDKKE
jgi:5-methylcytosine-specific restriction protein A